MNLKPFLSGKVSFCVHSLCNFWGWYIESDKGILFVHIYKKIIKFECSPIYVFDVL